MAIYFVLSSSLHIYVFPLSTSSFLGTLFAFVEEFVSLKAVKRWGMPHQGCAYLCENLLWRRVEYLKASSFLCMLRQTRRRVRIMQPFPPRSGYATLVGQLASLLVLRKELFQYSCVQSEGGVALKVITLSRVTPQECGKKISYTIVTCTIYTSLGVSWVPRVVLSSEKIVRWQTMCLILSKQNYVHFAIYLSKIVN